LSRWPPVSPGGLFGGPGCWGRPKWFDINNSIKKIAIFIAANDLAAEKNLGVI
jgi:hypothetical protein